MSDLVENFSFTYAEVISIDPLIEHNFKMHYYCEISQYEILDWFIVTKYTQVLKNIILKDDLNYASC